MRSQYQQTPVCVSSVSYIIPVCSTQHTYTQTPIHTHTVKKTLIHTKRLNRLRTKAGCVSTMMGARHECADNGNARYPEIGSENRKKTEANRWKSLSRSRGFSNERNEGTESERENTQTYRVGGWCSMRSDWCKWRLIKEKLNSTR